MSVSGRTFWWMKDCGWWRREVVVELGEEFGPVGPAVLDWLSAEAKQQSVNDGYVKAGYRTLARGVFSDVTVRHVVSRAVELGALKDFEEGARTFTCRISGFKRDQERGQATMRKQRQRDRESQAAEPNPGDVESVTERDESRTVTPDRDVSRDVTKREEKSREEGSSLRSDSVAASGDGPEPVRLDAARQRLQSEQVDRVWSAYDETRRAVLGNRSTAKLTPARRQLIARRLRDWHVDELVDAVRGWRHSPHHRGENDRATPYCDPELILRDAAHIERFRDLERNGGDAGGRGTTAPRPAGPGGGQQWRQLLQPTDGGAA